MTLADLQAMDRHAREESKRQASDRLCKVMCELNADIRESENLDYIKGLKKAKEIVNSYIED